MASTKKLINDVESVVDDSLAGYVAVHPHLALLENCRRVVLRRDIDSFRSADDKVTLLCGGGSGHEPAFAGYVGAGMLSAAVAGNVFASPPPAHIHAALSAIGNKKGTVVFVINYTGDRLNFGLATERERQRRPGGGGALRTVTIAEDTALMSGDRSAGRRGLAGCTLVLKIGGALADRGASVDEIEATCNDVIANLGTIGLSYSSCSLPGRGPIFHLEDDQMELGLGVHGEPGVQRTRLTTAKDTVDTMLTHMTQKSSTRLPLTSGCRVALLVNNLGGTSQIEMNILCREASLWLENRGVIIDRFYCGTLMTSLEMQGFSISVLVLKDGWTQLFDHPTEAAAWPKFETVPMEAYKVHLAKITTVGGLNATTVDDSSVRSSAQIPVTEREMVKRMILAICGVLIENANVLDSLDEAVGDGDCGSTMARGAKAMRLAIESGHLPTSDMTSMLEAISTVWDTIGGTTGAIYAILLSAAARSFADAKGAAVTMDSVAEACHQAVDAVMRYGQALPGDRTLVDPLMAAVEALNKSKGQSTDEHLLAAVQAAESAVEATATMKAKAGRASYVAAANQTKPDPGAKAVALWMRAALSAYGEMERTTF